MRKYDLLFIHTPSIFDFRDRDDVLFSYLSNSESISSSQIYEIYPLGLKTMLQSLTKSGKKVGIINLAQMMLRDPKMDVKRFLRSVTAKLFGIDLHWLVHAHGALSVAKLLKELHPATPILLGGLASNLFYDELMEYPQIDFVVRGLACSKNVKKLVNRLDVGGYEHIPNLCWKDSKGSITFNKCQEIEAYDELVDWSGASSKNNTYFSIPGAGCEYNCTFCSGSKYSMKKYFHVKNGFAAKPISMVWDEILSIKQSNDHLKKLITVHHWFENIELLKKGLDYLQSCKVGILHLTLYQLISQQHLRLISNYPIRPHFEISIESSDEAIRKLCGKSDFSNLQLEQWLDTLFLIQPKAIVEIYMMIGLPKQSPEKVNEDVIYVEYLLQNIKK